MKQKVRIIAPRYNTCMFSIFLNTHLEEIVKDV